ncbi:MAG: hypothetical protein ACI8V2_001875 [Candidatus Latescibacterota bacterium]|jgi:hypothetical protein
MKQKKSVKAKSEHRLNEAVGRQVPLYWILLQQVMSDIYMQRV